MDDLENSAENLRRALDDLADTGSLTDESLRNLNRTQGKLSRATESFIRGTTKAVGSMYDYGDSIKKNRDQISALNPAIDGVTGAFKLLGPVAGALGDALGGVAKVATELADETLQAYVNAANIGATGVEAMTALRDQATNMEVDVRRFAQTIAQSSEDLSRAFGTTAEGASVISGVTASMASQGLRESLFNLGYTLDQIPNITADYAERSTMIGLRQERDYARLARSASNYLYELDTLSKLTGKSREALSAEIKERNNDVRFLAWQRNLAKQLSREEADARIAEVNKLLSAVGSVDPTLVKPFMDAMNGMSQEAVKISRISPELYKLTQGLADGTATTEQVLRELVRGSTEFANTLDTTAAATGGMLGQTDDVYLSAARIAGAGDELLENYRKAGEATKGTASGSDELAENLAKLQTSLLSQAQVFQAFDDKLMDLVDGPLESFGTAIGDLTRWIGETTGVVPERPGTEPGRATGGYMQPDTTYRVGEFGPELVQFDQGATVTSTNDLRNMSKQEMLVKHEFVPTNLTNVSTASSDFAKPNLTEFNIETLENVADNTSKMTELLQSAYSRFAYDIVSARSTVTTEQPDVEINELDLKPVLSGPLTEYKSSLNELSSVIRSELEKQQTSTNNTTTVIDTANTKQLDLLEAQLAKLDEVVRAMTKGNDVSKQILRSSTV